MAVALLSRRSQSRHSTTTIIATTTTTTTTMKMKMMRLSGMLILWGVFCEIILYQGGNGTGGVALAFEIQSISHGRRQPSSSFPFPTTTTTTSTSTTSTSSSRMTDVPLHLRMRNPTGYRKRTTGSSTTTTELSLFRRIRRLFRRGKKDDASTVVPVTPPAPEVQYEKIRVKKRKSIEKDCSICVIGGGVAGLAAALTAAETLHQEPTKNKKKIILLEAGPKVGGRVQSDTTADGYTLDRGFAVFIEEYPMAKKILDYDALQLGQFLPGALVKVPYSDKLARVADPFRQPEELLGAVSAPVGSMSDKLALLPLILKEKTTSVDQIFKEEETDTLDLLTRKWFISDVLLEEFFKPFLEGIYLAPLQEQSSRMFNFIFKMFTDGAAALPRGGMQAIAQQLADKATAKGVDIRTSQPVAKLSRLLEQDGGGYLIETQDGKTRIQANVVIIATDGVVSQKMISQMDGFEYLEGLATQQPQRSVGCLYYSFAGAEPVQEPILILNGMGKRERGSFENPVNNACFPSVVNMGYAPNGCGLCSVTVLEPAMSAYEGQEDKLDKAVRKQLATWFPEYEQEVLKTWKLRRIYRIPRAQPGQLGGPYPANVNGGRDCSMYRGRTLPAGLLVCGDHMATATLNGALESGVKAGEEAAAEAVN